MFEKNEKVNEYFHMIVFGKYFGPKLRNGTPDCIRQASAIESARRLTKSCTIFSQGSRTYYTLSMLEKQQII